MGIDSTGNFQTVLFLILILTAILVPIILGIRELVVRVKLARSGVKVVGHIIDHSKEGNYKNRKYYITYDYDYNGSTYSREERVTWLIYDYYVNDEDRATVCCLPENPKTARLGYKIPGSIVGMGLDVAVILIGIVVAIIAAAIILIWIVEALDLNWLLWL